MRIKFLLPFIMLLVFSNFVQAQKPSRVTIKGSLQDTVHEAVPFATVMLLSPADSSLVNFTTSNDKGEFTFNNVKNNKYLFKVSHMSFLPLQKLIEPSATELNDLLAIPMKPISQLLLEVVIRAA